MNKIKIPWYEAKVTGIKKINTGIELPNFNNNFKIPTKPPIEEPARETAKEPVRETAKEPSAVRSIMPSKVPQILPTLLPDSIPRRQERRPYAPAYSPAYDYSKIWEKSDKKIIIEYELRDNRAYRNEITEYFKYNKNKNLAQTYGALAIKVGVVVAFAVLSILTMTPMPPIYSY